MGIVKCFQKLKPVTWVQGTTDWFLILLGEHQSSSVELVIETFEMLSVHNTRSPSFPTFRTTLAFGITALIFELLMLFIYGFFIDYTFISSKVFDGFGPFLVFALGILVLVGFGLLLTYIQTAGWTGLSYNLLITCVTMQLYFLVNALFTKVNLQSSSEHTTALGYRQMELTPYLSNYGSSFSDAFRCCISMTVMYSVLHARIGLLETFGCTVAGNVAYEVNRQILQRISCVDNGGSMTIFAFGAAFGLTIAIILDRRHSTLLHPKYKASRESTLLAFVGTLFVWCLFPVLNTTRNLEAAKYNAIANPFTAVSPISTWLALAGSTLSSYCTSILVHDRISPNDIIFGSFAGAVTFGASSSLTFYPVAPIVTGTVAGIVAVLCLSFMRRWNATRGVLDTNGAVEAFLVPGVLGAIWAAIYAAFSGGSYDYLTKYYNYPSIGGNFIQGGLEIAGIFITLGIAIIVGILVGYFVRRMNSFERDDHFDDGTSMTIEDDGLWYKGARDSTIYH